jgi:hypothetical protein
MFQMDTQKMKLASNRFAQIKIIWPFNQAHKRTSTRRQSTSNRSAHVDRSKRPPCPAVGHFRSAVSLIQVQGEHSRKKPKFFKTVAIFRLEKQTTAFITCAHASRWVVTRSKFPPLSNIFCEEKEQTLGFVRRVSR